MERELDCRFCNATLVLEGEVGRKVVCPGCQSEIFLAPENLQPGLVLGDFRLVRHLGSGAMGHVFSAEQLSLQREVALKIFSREYTPDQESLDRFLGEMRLIASLDHPNIVTALTAGEQDGVCYLAMTLVEGDDLEMALKKQGHLPEKQVLEIARKMGEALRYAWNTRQMLHRDIKPSNIRLTRSGEPMLLDLGIAKSTREDSGRTMDGFIVGTPYYMSPEQARGARDLDFRSDIYALGATMYHLVVGSVPFDAESSMAVVTKHITDPFPDPAERRPELSAAICELLEILMAKDRADRPASWDEFLTMVTRVAHGQMPRGDAGGSRRKKLNLNRPAAAASVTPFAIPPPVAPRKTGMSPLKQVLAGLCVLVLVLGGVYALLLYQKQLQAMNQQPETPDAPIRLPAIRPPPRQPPVAPPDATPDTGVVTPPSQPAAPPTTPVTPDDPLVAIQRLSLEDLLLTAKHQPELLERVLAEVRRLRQEVSNPALQASVDEALETLRLQRQAVFAALVTRLVGEAEALVAEGRYDEAPALLRNYSGPHDQVTQKAREQAATALTERLTQRPDYQEYLAKRAERDFARLTAFVAEEVAASRLDSAEKALAEGRADAKFAAFLPRLGELAAQLALLREADRLIAAGFQGDIGKTISIAFTDGPLEYRILAVKDGVIEAERTLAHLGRLQRRIRPGELTARERFMRLGEEKTPQKNLLRGLLLLEAQRAKTAEPWFQEAGGPLGQALLALAQSLSAAPAPAPPPGG